VADRAIFTAFSTASAPELNSADRFSYVPGVSSLSFSATATYSSYGVTMKQVWVKSATCACTASTTRGAALPTDVTAIPEPKSMSWLPSASTTMPPPARSTYTGSTVPTPLETAAFLRACNSFDRGPGISVFNTRRCSTVIVPPRSPRCAQPRWCHASMLCITCLMRV
jgi:hypothetical protein